MVLIRIRMEIESTLIIVVIIETKHSWARSQKLKTMTDNNYSISIQTNFHFVNNSTFHRSIDNSNSLILFVIYTKRAISITSGRVLE